MTENTKQQVREFYDQIGWQEVRQGQYQNAHYEDLRPVSSEYVHRSHMRVNHQLNPSGHLLLDAGSGPVQYSEYLTYSKGYDHRVCLDISVQALKEARERLGDHGLYVVADIANLPFKPEVFDGIVSLHTIHHLPVDEHRQAYLGLYRVLKPGGSAVVVNGWTHPALTTWLESLVIFLNRARRFLRGKPLRLKTDQPKGTFVRKTNAHWLRRQLGNGMPIEILVWRTLSTRLLRTFIHPHLGGQHVLRFISWLEERFPHFFGENGQYPLIVISKVKGENL